MPNITTILDKHVTLQLECIDRLYLNGYVPALQTEGGVRYFLGVHRSQPVPSPACLAQMTKQFVAKTEQFAQKHDIPVVSFAKGQRKEEVAKGYYSRFARAEGVVFVGVAQERSSAFRSLKEVPPLSPYPRFSFYRGSVFVKHFYFYILDRDFGPCFIKFSTYFPFQVRVWINGQEWVKRQLAHERIQFEPLENGLLSVEDPTRAQEICDSLSAEHVDCFFRKWLARLPHPFSPQDRAADYRYRLSILQFEVSRTEVFDRPLHGRQLFEEVIRENIDLGRPDRVELIFDRRIRKQTPGSFRTRILTEGVDPRIRVDYKNSSIKQYLKESRALRTETTINDTRDFGIGRSLRHLDQLRSIGRNANRRLLTIERLSQNCAVSSTTVERVVLPTTGADDQRAPGLRFGDPRVMALLAALCLFLHLPHGFSNKMLRPQVAALLGKPPSDYSTACMSYDLRRLRLKQIIQRIPDTHRYVLTPAGRRIALFFTKSYARVLKPAASSLDAAPCQDSPPSLARAWQQLDSAIDEIIRNAQLVPHQ